MEPWAPSGYIDSGEQGAWVLLTAGRSKGALVAAAAAAAGLVLTPTFASAQGNAKKRAPAVAVSFDPVASFTPANADPRLAKAFGGRGVSLSDFKFTPAAAKSRPSQVRVAIRARSDAPGRARLADAAAATAAAPVSALTPASYNLGVAVGWRRFAVAADVAQAKAANPAIGSRESAALGVSYSVKRFTGRVAAGVERGDKRAITDSSQADKYSVDLGAAYSITPKIAVTGGVRYRIDQVPALKDDRRDSQAVYVGTAFKF